MKRYEQLYNEKKQWLIQSEWGSCNRLGIFAGCQMINCQRHYCLEWPRDDLHKDRLITFWSCVAKIWEMRHQWPKTEPNGDNPWLAPTVHADHGTRRRRSHQKSDVISLRETPVVSIVLRNVWFLSFCLAFLIEGNKWWMQWLGWRVDLNNCIVNTTKYKQYAINIKQQLQMNTHSNWKTFKVDKLYRNCIVVVS